MKPLGHIVALVAVCGMCAGQAFAQRSSSAAQTVTFSVHRTNGPISLASQSSASQNVDQMSERSASTAQTRAYRSQPKLTLAADLPRQRNLSFELDASTSAAGADTGKRYAERQHVSSAVVVTVSD